MDSSDIAQYVCMSTGHDLRTRGVGARKRWVEGTVAGHAPARFIEQWVS